jgi:hypothetical protein
VSENSESVESMGEKTAANSEVGNREIEEEEDGVRLLGG